MENQSSTLTSRDTCHPEYPEWNYEQHPHLAKTTYEWRMGRTKYGLGVVMRGPDGRDTVYAKESAIRC